MAQVVETTPIRLELIRRTPTEVLEGGPAWVLRDIDSGEYLRGADWCHPEGSYQGDLPTTPGFVVYADGKRVRAVVVRRVIRE